MEDYLCPACEEDFQHAIILEGHDVQCPACGSLVGMRYEQLEDLRLLDEAAGIMDDELDTCEP